MDTHCPLRTALTAVTIGLVLSVLAGCVNPPAPTGAMLTYETRPEGASLYEGGQSIGVAPVTRVYPAQGAANTVRTPQVTAVWPSGARETFYTLLPLGSDRAATIERPAGAAGLELDLEHARKLALQRDEGARRNTEALLRDQRRNSDRCRAQAAGASKAVQDDC